MNTKEVLVELEKDNKKIFILKELQVVVASTKDGRTVIFDTMGQIMFDVDLETIDDWYSWEKYKPPLWWFI